MKDLFQLAAIVGFIAFVIWIDNQWEISPQDIQQGTIPTQNQTP